MVSHTKRTWGIAAGFLLGCLSALPASAQSLAPPVHQGTTGEISALTPTSITVMKMDGKQVTFVLSSKTKFFLDGHLVPGTKLSLDELAMVASTDGTSAVAVLARLPLPVSGKGVLGEISVINDDSITIMKVNGTTATFMLSPKTKVVVNGSASEAGNLEEGQMAAVASQNGIAAVSVNAQTAP